MDRRVQERIARIPPVDNAVQTRARARQDALTKPQGGSGPARGPFGAASGHHRRSRPRFRRKIIVMMASDHGVVAERISAYPPDVTAQTLHNFLVGGAAINVFAEVGTS